MNDGTRQTEKQAQVLKEYSIIVNRFLVCVIKLHMCKPHTFADVSSNVNNRMDFEKRSGFYRNRRENGAFFVETNDNDISSRFIILSHLLHLIAHENTMIDV